VARRTRSLRMSAFILFTLSVIVVVELCAAKTTRGELIINGDAETGDISGWVDGGIEVVSNAAAGTLGLPLGVDIGDFSFTGALGPTLETLSQSVDVTAFSSQIDAGAAKSIFSALLQSRSTGGIIDTAKTNLSFVDGGGGQLESVTFEDTDVTTFDWEQVLDERVVPVGTRSIEITLEATRTGGVSTDAFFDNFSLNVTPRCDFNVDAFCDIDDIDALIAEIVAGTDNAIFDLTGNGQVTLADVTDDNDG
jgi:hypothetical protein